MTGQLASRKCAVASHTAAAVSVLISAVLIGPFIAASAQQPATAIAGDTGFATSLDSTRNRLESLPADVIKQRYLQCSAEATEHRLSGGEAALCSTIYEVLLRRHFGADFSALLAWSRQQPVAKAEAQSEPVATDRARRAPADAMSLPRGQWI